MSERYIHDEVTHTIEVLGRQCLREEVGQIVNRVDIWHPDLHILDAFTHEEVSAIDVFGPRMQLRVIKGWAR